MLIRNAFLLELFTDSVFVASNWQWFRLQHAVDNVRIHFGFQVVLSSVLAMLLLVVVYFK